MYREQSKLSLVGYLLGPSGKRERLGLGGGIDPPDFERYINPISIWGEELIMPTTNTAWPPQIFRPSYGPVGRLSLACCMNGFVLSILGVH